MLQCIVYFAPNLGSNMTRMSSAADRKATT